MIVVVCDIRDFTDFTAKVHDYIYSNYSERKKVKKLQSTYTDYVSKTRRIAKDALLKDVKDCERAATKSTGDGFMIALSLCDDPSQLKKNQKYPDVERMLINLMKLVEDSDLRSKGGEFAAETKKILRHWGPHLGISSFRKREPDYTKQASFRLAGAVALGVGFFTDNPLDALGHPVNLAFRLCDKALRYSKGRNALSPPILIAKECGRFLLDNGFAAIRKKGRLKHWEFSIHREKIDLKGIEESWCYALNRKDNR